MKKHIIGLFTIITLLSLSFSSTALAAGFVQDSGGVKYQYDDGTFAINTFVQVVDSIYHLDENGYVQFGWIQVGELWYFLDSNGICVNPWGESDPPEEVVQKEVAQETSSSTVSSGWTPYSTSDLNTLADAIAKGYVVYDGTQYWASPEYVKMISNTRIVYINDISSAPAVDRFATANLQINW